MSEYPLGLAICVVGDLGRRRLPHEVRRFVSGQRRRLSWEGVALFLCAGGACLTIAGGELKLKGNLLLYKFARQKSPRRRERGAGGVRRAELLLRENNVT